VDNGRLHEMIGVSIGVSRDAASCAWLAMTAKGKQKGKDLQAASRIREAILHDQTVHAETGNVTWRESVMIFRNEEDFETFAKAVRRFVDDDGVDFGLSTGALELQAKVEETMDGIKAAKKAAEARRTPASAS